MKPIANQIVFLPIYLFVAMRQKSKHRYHSDLNIIMLSHSATPIKQSQFRHGAFTVFTYFGYMVNKNVSQNSVTGKMLRSGRLSVRECKIKT